MDDYGGCGCGQFRPPLYFSFRVLRLEAKNAIKPIKPFFSSFRSRIFYYPQSEMSLWREPVIAGHRRSASNCIFSFWSLETEWRDSRTAIVNGWELLNLWGKAFLLHVNLGNVHLFLDEPDSGHAVFTYRMECWIHLSYEILSIHTLLINEVGPIGSYWPFRSVGYRSVQTINYILEAVAAAQHSLFP